MKGTLDVKGILAINNKSTLIVEKNARLNLTPSGKIIVYRGGVLQIDSAAAVNLNGGTIQFEDSASATINDELGLRGEGSIVNSNILWKKTFQPDDTTHITFKEGGILDFQSASPKLSININGSVTFEGSDSVYTLGANLGIIYVSEGGLLLTKILPTFIQQRSPIYSRRHTYEKTLRCCTAACSHFTLTD